MLYQEKHLKILLTKNKMKHIINRGIVKFDS